MQIAIQVVSKLLFGGIVLLTFTGCGGKLAGMSDGDLVDKMNECNARPQSSPTTVQQCKNYRRECDRRREETGYYIC